MTAPKEGKDEDENEEAPPDFKPFPVHNFRVHLSFILRKYEINF